MFRKFLVMAVVAVTASLVAPTLGQAAFSVNLSSTSAGATPASDKLVTDYTSGPIPGNGTVFDIDSAFRGITLGTINTPFPDQFAVHGAFNIRFSASAAELASGAVVLGSTGAFSIANTSNSVATLVLTLQETAFNLPSGPGAFFVRNKLTNLQFAPGSATFTLTNESNAFDGTTSSSPNILSVTQATPLPFAGSQSTSWTRTGGGSYTVQNIITLVLSGNSTLTFQASSEVLPTPAPAGLLLAAFGIPAFGLLRRIGRKSGAAQVAV